MAPQLHQDRPQGLVEAGRKLLGERAVKFFKMVGLAAQFANKIEERATGILAAAELSSLRPGLHSLRRCAFILLGLPATWLVARRNARTGYTAFRASHQ